MSFRVMPTIWGGGHHSNQFGFVSGSKYWESRQPWQTGETLGHIRSVGVISLREKIAESRVGADEVTGVRRADTIIDNVY